MLPVLAQHSVSRAWSPELASGADRDVDAMFRHWRAVEQARITRAEWWATMRTWRHPITDDWYGRDTIKDGPMRDPTARLQATQQLVDDAAEQLREAWLNTGRRACYLLAEARPTTSGVGALRYDGLLLLDRARRAREMAQAWTEAADAWEAAERQTNAP
jgi:hypothetical protein